jgi:hypothetical protein
MKLHPATILIPVTLFITFHDLSNPVSRHKSSAKAYWSINVTMVRGGGDLDGGLQCDIAELDFYTVVGGSDVATGGSPLGSPGLFGGDPPFAFDDNLATNWSGLGHTPGDRYSSAARLSLHSAPEHHRLRNHKCGEYELGAIFSNRHDT